MGLDGTFGGSLAASFGFGKKKKSMPKWFSSSGGASEGQLHSKEDAEMESEEVLFESEEALEEERRRREALEKRKNGEGAPRTGKTEDSDDDDADMGNQVLHRFILKRKIARAPKTCQ